MAGDYLSCPVCGDDVTTLPGTYNRQRFRLEWEEGESADCPGCGSTVEVVVDEDEDDDGVASLGECT